MRLAKIKAAVVGATVLAGLIVALPASATPFVDVRATWSARQDPLYASTPGIAISCYGDAIADGDGCGGHLSLDTSVTTSGHLSATFNGGLVLTNTTNAFVDGYLYLMTGFSSFNPGGPDIGLSIDDALTEGARFNSSVGGAGVGDFHSCSIGLYGDSGSLFSPTSCGVHSPDSSDSRAGIDVSAIAPGGTLQLPYTILIDSDFILPPIDPPQDSGVPEPASAAGLLVGLLGLRLRKRR